MQKGVDSMHQGFQDLRRLFESEEDDGDKEDEEEEEEDDDNDDDSANKTPKQLVELAIGLNTNKGGNTMRFREYLDAAKKKGDSGYTTGIDNALKVFKCNSSGQAKEILRELIRYEVSI